MSRRFIYAVVCVWVAVLIVGSLLPERMKDAMGTPAGAHPHFHTAVHLVAFGATSLLLVSLARTSSQKIAALLTVIAIGISVEILQHVLYRSTFERWDVLNDTLSAILGYLLALSRVVMTPAVVKSDGVEADEAEAVIGE